jgi:O-antigen ligase
VSIFAAQCILTLCVLIYLARLLKGQTTLARLPLDAPTLAFCAWTLLSASFATDPLAAHAAAKKIVLFVLLYIGVDSFRTEPGRERVVVGALLGGLLLAAGAIAQFYFLGFDTLNNRPRSFMGHYMTASGLSMGILILSGARLLFGRVPRERPRRLDWIVLASVVLVLGLETALQRVGAFSVWPERVVVLLLALAVLLLGECGWPGPATSFLLGSLAFPLSAWALVLSQTRNAWLGSLAGLGVLGILKAPKLLWLLPVGAVAALVLRPGTLERLTVTDPASLDRYYMWQAGIDMIKDKPILGQGPGLIIKTYPAYRWPQAPSALAPHLHDNALQIAAERGLPCLVWWLWWMAAAMGDAFRETREGPPGLQWGAHAALAFLTAVVVAGIFEYNFGDSEIFMFLLIVVALPYGLRRGRGVPAV